jgi:hypothetical protein
MHHVCNVTLLSKDNTSHCKATYLFPQLLGMTTFILSTIRTSQVLKGFIFDATHVIILMDETFVSHTATQTNNRRVEFRCSNYNEHQEYSRPDSDAM